MSINWLHRKPYTQQFRFEVFEAYIGLSVIDFFAQRFAFKSRDYWLRLIEEGKITVNRQGVDPNQILKANDLIHTVRDDVQEPPVNPDYKIIYDQDGVLVINKPAPLPVHPAGRFNKNTLLYLLREQHPDRKFHTIHRLDAHTSGVLIMATESQRARFLHLQMEKNQMQKVYGVIAKGDFGTETFVVDLPVGRVCRVKRGYGAGLEEGKDAKTEFTPLHKPWRMDFYC
ncbi:MAG: hypothetical protein H7A33_04065 [Deltaproteobacteria bacterium]|nr:hypothetical protein [Deltaproteobacteria bacterium]